MFHAQIAEEGGKFAFGDVVEGVTSKMVRRHPHVFSEAAKPPPAKSGVDKIWDAMRARRAALDGGDDHTDELPSHHGLVAAMKAAENKAAFSNATWESIKAEERKAKGASGKSGLLADVPGTLPGLSRAVKLQKKASTVGFDWGNAKLVLAKIREEIDEIEAAMDKGARNGGADAVGEEIGDLLFAVANLARHAGVDPEGAVRDHQRQVRAAFRLHRSAAWRQRGHRRKRPTSKRWMGCGTRPRRRGYKAVEGLKHPGASAVCFAITPKNRRRN